MKSRWCVFAGKRYIFGMFLLGLMVCLISGSAQAQDQGKITLFGGYSWLSNNWGESVAGYDYGFGSFGDTGLSGYTGSFVYNFNEHIGLEANFSGHNGSPTLYTEPSTSTDTGYRDFERQDFYFYTFGPKLTLPLFKGFAVFGHVLVGGAHAHTGYTECTLPTGSSSCETTDQYNASVRGDGFALKTGAGLDWDHGHWGVRIIEADFVYLSTPVSASCNDCGDAAYKFTFTGTDAEISTGVTYTFLGRKAPPPPRPMLPPTASCSLQPGSVVQDSNGMVAISAMASDPQSYPLTYSWSATGGTVDGTGPQVRWTPGNAAPGSYTVTASVANGHGGMATCAVSPAVTARVYRPPTVTLTSDRDTVLVGENVNFTAQGLSPDNLPLTYSWQANCGQLAPSTATTDVMSTTGVNPGTCTATVRVQDNHGGAADASKGVNIQAPPPPPQASKINTCDFSPAASSRVDNVCKRILDDVALRMQNEPRATIVVIGYAASGRNSERIATDRAEHTADYLAGKGVDRSRISTRPGTAQVGESSSRIDVIWVPEGATY